VCRRLLGRRRGRGKIGLGEGVRGEIAAHAMGQPEYRIFRQHGGEAPREIGTRGQVAGDQPFERGGGLGRAGRQGQPV
jgi:hypothetical protein